MQTITVNCFKCSEPFTAELHGLLHATICDPCAVVLDQERREREKTALYDFRVSQWEKICSDSEYRTTDPTRLPAAQWSQVRDWMPGARGLLLHGPTRRCKTRCAWLMLQSHFLNGHDLMAFSETALSREMGKRFLQDVAAAAHFVEKLEKVDILFLDDIGKGRATDRYATELWSLVEKRTASRKPIVATMNASGDALAERLGQDIGEPVIRRLREFCEVVEF